MSSFVETNRNQLNTSHFKQLYSFPKAQRFNQSGFVSSAPYYDNRVTSFGRRAPSFGYGNKYSLEKKDPYPPPNHYTRDGSFELDLKQKRGNAFTHSRKKGLVSEEEIGVVPGPGKYNFKTDRQDFKRVSYSMRGKFADPVDVHQNTLGPGQYSATGNFDGKGKYLVSKYQDSGCGKIGKSKRFTSYQTISPGPGNYTDDKVTGTNNSGTYFTSNFRTSKANSFGLSARKHIADPSSTPGPGSYQRFSDFPSRHRR